MRRRQRPQRRQIQFDFTVPIVMVIAVTLGALLSYFWAPSPSPSPSPLPSPAPRALDVEDIIKEGDEAFRRYDYSYALNNYLRAEDNITELISFESGSPSKDEDLLQHYYNIRTLLKVRIELTSTAKGISHLNMFRSHSPTNTVDEVSP